MQADYQCAVEHVNISLRGCLQLQSEHNEKETTKLLVLSRT
jgi:hypothetical protein